MSVLSRRERLHRCYFNEQVDRPAVYTRVGYPRDCPTYTKMRAYMEANSELKGNWNSAAVQTTKPRTEGRTEPVSEDWERHIATLYTPKGELECASLLSLKGQPGLSESYFLKSREDAEKYLSLPMPELGGDVAGFFELDREMGDRGIVQCGAGSNAGGMVVRLFGSELFAIMSIMDRDLIHTLLERELQVILNRLKYVISRGVGPHFCMSGQEYISPPLHGPRDFGDFNVKYDKPVIDMIHDAGGRVHIHCHGSVKKVMQQFVDMGTDVLHPFEGPPLGDITPAEAKARCRDRLCLEGNIQIADMYEQSPENIREQTEGLIRDCFDDRKGLIVCPTASPYVRGGGERALPQYRAMVEAVLAYRG